MPSIVMFSSFFNAMSHLCRSLPVAVLLGTAGLLSGQVPPVAEDIRPAKAPVEIPAPPESPLEFWIPFTCALLAVLVASWLLRKFGAKSKMKSPPEVALASLQSLEMNRESLTAESFASSAALTVRQYIFDRFGLAAPRRTTEEFLRDVETSPLIKESDHLRLFLKSCDLAKFAGSHLDANQRAELIAAARGFVRATAADPGKEKPHP
jgi:hypothetical protein